MKEQELLRQKAVIFGSIFTLANRLQNVGDKMDPRLTVKQWLLLAGIFQSETQSPTISQVAGLTGNSRQNVKKMVAILEKEGFVTLQKDEKDSRMLRITLTDHCRRYLKGREELENRFLEELFSGFEAGQLAAMNEGIQKLQQNIQEMERRYTDEE